MKLNTICMCGVLCVAAVIVNDCSGMMVNERLMELIRRLENLNAEGALRDIERQRLPTNVWTPRYIQIWEELQNHFGSDVSQRELVSIATLVSQLFGLPNPGREERRRKVVLIRWFCANWEAISPILSDIDLRQEDGTVIGRSEVTDS